MTKTPFGGLPPLELPGRPVLAQTNAILVLIGRRHGLHPRDDFEAARHEAMMAYAEDLRASVSAPMRMPEEEKKRTRASLVAGYLPDWGARAEAPIGDGPFFGGAELNVVDLKLHMIVRWLSSGKVDYIPATIFAPLPQARSRPRRRPRRPARESLVRKAARSPSAVKNVPGDSARAACGA